MIKLTSLNKFFNKGAQNEIHVINDVSLELPEKGMISVFGQSGCGKTTLLNVIGGLDSFGSGSVSIDGNDIKRDTDKLRNKYIGYVFQNYNLNKNETCFENVANALRLCGIRDKDEIKKRVNIALKNVGMDKYEKRLPDMLSGGQQQRVAIARAIVKNPKIILADEPTGNLDEINTVMVMNLLKKISRDHLVILVTHEQKLVNFYCDKIIELSDGKIVNVRDNDKTDGYVSKNKNDIFLGELEKSEISSENAQVEFYGNKPEEPIKIKIVNNSGRYYLKVESPNVKYLDESSEIRLMEGCFEEKAKTVSEEDDIDMSGLPEISDEGNDFGRLFTLKNAIKSGYANYFKRKKKVLFFLCMALFTITIVTSTAFLGTGIGNLIDAKNRSNKEIFRVYCSGSETYDRIYSSVGKEESGIDLAKFVGKSSLSFVFHHFETAYNINSYVDVDNAIYMPQRLFSSLGLIAGRNTDLKDNEIVITTKIADSILEKSTLNFISEYEHLVGVLTQNNLKVVGIVDSGESYVLANDLTYAKLNLSSHYETINADIYDTELQNGEIIFIQDSGYSDDDTLKNGDTVKICGRDFTVKKVITFSENYDDFLRKNGYSVVSPSLKASLEVKNSNPSIDENSQEFADAVSNLLETKYFEFADEYYSYIDEFLKAMEAFSYSDEILYYATNRNLLEAKFQFVKDDLYYKAQKYKELTGSYPDTLSVLDTLTWNREEILNEYQTMHSEEFWETIYGAYSSQKANVLFTKDDFFFVANAFYALSDTDLRLTSYSGGYYYYVSYGDGYSNYAVIHSSNPELTENYLKQNFSDVVPPYEDEFAIITPQIEYESYVQDCITDIVTSTIVLLVILVAMNICMYSIMRSGLLTRIKEIGIYRAIGVKKKNIVFLFFIESLIIVALTVTIIFVIASFIAIKVSSSTLIEGATFYPWWLSVLSFVFICGSAVICGTLPVILLLTKTPSAIISKYDI